MQQNFYGNNIIITDPSSNLRALGRNALAGKWQSAIIAVIVYTLCVQLPPAILNTLFGVDMGELYSMNMGYSYNVGVDGYSTVYNSMPAYSPLSGIYSLLVTGAMDLGLTLFFLAMFRRQIVGIGDVFLGFERYGKALGLFCSRDCLSYCGRCCSSFRESLQLFDTARRSLSCLMIRTRAFVSAWMKVR